MNKLLAICGLVFIGNAATPNVEQYNAQLSSPSNEIKCPLQVTPVKLINSKVSASVKDITFLNAKSSMGSSNRTTEALDLNKIVFLESEEQIDLGFDTADYLPEDFNPNEVYVDLNKVTYMEFDEDTLLELNIADYLPEDFNAYAIPADIRSISYIKEEPVLNFDTTAYLPEGFDPYEYYFDIHSVEYIEDDDEVELDFNTQNYLPRGFDPYSR